jgi:uncharacterized OsmC-like protein
MAQTHVQAEFQDRRQIVFTARERSMVNVRVESTDGGPIGYTSYELLLIALANCTLGVVMGHESLKDLEVRNCRAELDATSVRGPSRIESIDVRVTLDVAGGTRRLQEILGHAADACPIGNTLKQPPRLTVSLVVEDSGAPAGQSQPVG